MAVKYNFKVFDFFTRLSHVRVAPRTRYINKCTTLSAPKKVCIFASEIFKKLRQIIHMQTKMLFQYPLKKFIIFKD